MILASIRATVVFPAPLSPTTAVTFPASSRTVTASTACTRAFRVSGPRPCFTQKDFVRLRPSSTAPARVADVPTGAAPFIISLTDLPPPARTASPPVQAWRAPKGRRRRLYAASTPPRAWIRRRARDLAFPRDTAASPSGTADRRRTPSARPHGRTAAP